MFECAITRVIQSDKFVTVGVAFFDVQGPYPVVTSGGRTMERYQRTKVHEDEYSFRRPVSLAGIEAFIRSRMQKWNKENGSPYKPTDFVVRLSSEAMGIE